MNVKKASTLLWAVTFVAIGLVGLKTHSFAGVWGPVSLKTATASILVDVCGAFAILVAIGVLIEPIAGLAAAAFFLFFTIWTAFVRLPFIIHAPFVEGSYQA